MEKTNITQAEIDAAGPTLTSHLTAAAGIIICNDNQKNLLETLYEKCL